MVFCVYGFVLQEIGECVFGYDIWMKYNIIELVVEVCYEGELNLDMKVKIVEFGKMDFKVVQEFYCFVFYYVDYGNGLDCYKVGFMLGGGMIVLMVGDIIVYLYCYVIQEILDNGLLCFIVKLVYNLLVVKGDFIIIEIWIIILDVGLYCNKIVVFYMNLKEMMFLVVGIVLYEFDGVIVVDVVNGYMIYVDLMDNVGGDNGKIFVGVVFFILVKEVKVVFFLEKEKKELCGGVDGYVLVISEYELGVDFIYYWGVVWSKVDIKDSVVWNVYMVDFVQKVCNLLMVIVK